jgi:FkbM family methyltransferase
MNHGFAREIGYGRFFIRKFLWRTGLAPKTMKLPTGSLFPLPKSKFFASDVYVSSGNVDWSAEHVLSKFLREHPAKREFLDVGANIGYYSALISPLASRVYSFEPDPRNHPYLNETLAGLKNACLVPKAVSDFCGTVSFSDQGESDISHIVPEGDLNVGMTAETLTVDSFVEENALNPLAIKIDIEGYDILALRGAVSTARRCSTIFLVEYNQEDDRPNTWAALQEFLGQTNYSIFCISRVPRGWNGYTYHFGQRETREMPDLSIKMLFLVSPAHLEWFGNFSTTHSTWTKIQLPVSNAS